MNNILLTIRAVAAIAVLLILSALPLHAADANDIANGMNLYLEKGGCPLCHGWAGDGRKTDNQMPDGANLRESALTRELIVMTIRCGRPGRSMPAYDRFAYSNNDGRCYGMKEADLKNNPLPDPPNTLQAREIERIADFLFAKVIKQGELDRAKCVAYWGREAEVCTEFKK